MPVLLVIVGVIWLMLHLAERARYRLPPGPTGLPFIGSYLSLGSVKCGHELFLKWAQEYGDIYTFRIFGTRFVLLNHYSLVHDSFQSADINDRAVILPFNRALGRKDSNSGLALVTNSEGPTWKEQRQFIKNMFRDIRAATNNFEDIVSAVTSKLMAEVARKDGALFDPAEMVTVSVSNITICIMTGKIYDYDDSEFVSMSKLASKVFDWMGPAAFLYHVPLLARLPLAINKKGDAVALNMMEFLTAIIRRHRESFTPDKKATDIIYGFLAEQHRRRSEGVDLGSFDNDCLVQLTLDFMLGGFETVSASLLWYFLCMAKYPKIQAKVQEELDRVVGRDRLPSLSDKPNLPYTQATIAECTRRYPAVPAQIPHGTRCDVKIGGYDIPKGSYVVNNSFTLAMSPGEWEDPECFRPERFLVDDGRGFNKQLEMKLATFGVGRRTCPAEQLARIEMFIMSTHLLQRFTLTVDEETALEGRSLMTFSPLPYRVRALAR
ncbi:cytochrome P450 2J5-like [Diadema antillarum]|uniref:cytochrome P450 2J5-like n=1 Tax=Diadema antillarum TaxID=105358 RepID=UPI003A89F487